MSLGSAMEVLRRMPLFGVLDESRLRVVAMTGDVLSYLPGERIAEKGDSGDAAFVILEGDVEVLIPTDAGERRLTTLHAGEIVGELAVLTGNPRNTALAAAGEIRLLRIEREVVLALLREYPEVALGVIRIIAERLEAVNARSA
ncbi:Crp/Fnr family transcriptional regulator [Paralimibaculum aggregatum]|uniref:Crp/Fnr family transcriptional regulator n=1 Tax=Paralimibaculum aggregatum TaxID=3036245 RepID=A0ABQ6LDS6_9RHOB|nr:cyclic nucleotide-binding domain-containing protein [Limibaculum sp. NKW23]GMG81510.1 Crp/Fnr family transcriptional regulator [Limibaculum sp. NKW23]